MTYQATIILSFGVSRTGLTDVLLQPYTAAGVETGGPLSPALKEFGRGRYSAMATLPDDARIVHAYSQATPSIDCLRGVAPPAAAWAGGANNEFRSDSWEVT